MTYVRLSVPVERGTADAARRLREWVSTPGFADLCAGVKTLDVGTLARIHEAVSALYFDTHEMIEIARGDRWPTEEGPPVEYAFRWKRAGSVGSLGGVRVKWRAGDPAGARERAKAQLAKDIPFIDAQLTNDEPRTWPVV